MQGKMVGVSEKIKRETLAQKMAADVPRFSCFFAAFPSLVFAGFARISLISALNCRRFLLAFMDRLTPTP